MAVNIGPKIGIDGEAKYRQELNNIIQQTKTLKSEYDKISAAGDKQNTSLKKNAEMHKVLGQQIEAQRDRVQKLSEMVRQSAEKYGEADTKTLKWKEALNQAEKELGDLEGKLKSLPSNLELVGQKMEAAGAKIKSVGDKMSDVGRGMTTYITAPIVGIGTASVAAFKEVDAAMDTVVTKTGATGEALKGMQKVVSDIAKTMPTDFQTAADAVGEVNARFELTGDELDKVSRQFIKFAKINNTDVSDSIDSVQSAMAAFGIKSKNAGLVLDTLNKAGQDTGVSIDKLSDALTTNAAGLSEMGYSLADSIFLMANFEKNGVDSASAMTGLKKALAESYKSGRPVAEILGELERDLRDTSKSTDAASAAMELFGSRAGGTLVKAIQDGRLSFADLGQEITDFGGNVDTTFTETLNPIDNFQQVMNGLKETGADLVQSAGPMLLDLAQRAAKVVKDLSDAWNSLDESQKEQIIKMAAIAAAAGPLLTIGGKATSGIGSLVQSGGNLVQMMGKLAPSLGSATGAMGGMGGSAAAAGASLGAILPVAAAVVAGIALLTGAFITAYKTDDEFASSVNTSWAEIKKSIMDTIETVRPAWEAFSQLLAPVFIAAMDSIKRTIDNLRMNIQGWIDIIGGIFSGDWGRVWTGAKEVVASSINMIISTVERMRDTIEGIFKKLDLKIPHIKLPHFKVESTDGFGLPKFKIDWYAKAMERGIRLDGATIFGANGNKMLGGGEAGPEWVVGENSLMGMIRSAVNGTGYTAGNTVTIGETNIYINGAGANAEEIADRVDEIITLRLHQAEAAWA